MVDGLRPIWESLVEPTSPPPNPMFQCLLVSAPPSFSCFAARGDWLGCIIRSSVFNSTRSIDRLSNCSLLPYALKSLDSARTVQYVLLIHPYGINGFGSTKYSVNAKSSGNPSDHNYGMVMTIRPEQTFFGEYCALSGPPASQSQSLPAAAAPWLASPCSLSDLLCSGYSMVSPPIPISCVSSSTLTAPPPAPQIPLHCSALLSAVLCVQCCSPSVCPVPLIDWLTTDWS